MVSFAVGRSPFFTVQYITYYDGKQDVSSRRQLHSMKALSHSCQSGSDSITVEQRIYCKMIFKDALSALKEAFEKEIPVPLAYGSP